MDDDKLPAILEQLALRFEYRAARAKLFMEQSSASVSASNYEHGRFIAYKASGELVRGLMRQLEIETSTNMSADSQH